MLKIKLQKTTEDAHMPFKASSDAACYDVYAHSITSKEEGKIAVGLGFKTEIPKGYKGILVPRSNLVKSFWMMNNSFGVIDADYRGEIKVILINLSNEPQTIQDGDRIAQMVFQQVEKANWELVVELEPTERGEGGFGHTGKK